MYKGQCNLEERELVEFPSVVKELGVNSLLDKIFNDTNIAMEHGDSEVQGNEDVGNISQKYLMHIQAFLKYIYSKFQYTISQMLRQNSSDLINMGKGGRVAMHKVNIGRHYANYDLRLI